MSENHSLTRRQMLAASGLAALSARGASPAAPATPVALAKCPSYDQDLIPVLSTAFDQIGGIGKLVRGKTVTIKLNLTGGPRTRFGTLPPHATHWVHPKLVGATCAVLGKAGARRIILAESCGGRIRPFEDFLLDAGWDVNGIRSAAPLVLFENTANLGTGKKYARLKVTGKPYIFPAFDLNQVYGETDVFVSMSKLKDHEELGVTLSIKNCFGNTPTSIYGDDAGVDEPNERPRGGRESVLHYGKRQPSRSAPAELDPSSNRYEGWRMPRILSDIAAARPIELNIVDGITSCVGGEGPWVKGSKPCNPGVLVIGRNPVCTDTVAMAVMGYDPRAKAGEGPFRIRKATPDAQKDAEGRQWADNTNLVAEAAGLGSADLSRIDVRGAKIKEAVFDFDAFRLGKA
jgi:uncharacterized protein (DUF362 family)